MNSTIKPKKRQLSCGHFDFSFSKNRCKMCASKGYKPIKRVSDKRRILLKEQTEGKYCRIFVF